MKLFRRVSFCSSLGFVCGALLGCGHGEVSGGVAGAVQSCDNGVCLTPPANSCQGGALRAFETVGECTADQCTYPSADIACANGCADGKCQGDVTPPEVRFINDGDGATDADYIASTTEWQGSWEFIDAESGIIAYEWGVGSAPLASDIVPLAPVGRRTKATATQLTLSAGGTYYITVKVTNGAGLSSTASSNGARAEPSPPSVVFIHDGLGADLAYQIDTTKLSANWQFTDPETGVVNYAWAIGTAPSGTNILARTDVGTATQATADNLSLVGDAVYYITVYATNGVGMTGVGSSNGVAIESSPPVVVAINDGRLFGDAAFSWSMSELSANWQIEDRQSGIALYEWAIGSTPGATDILSSTSVGTATSATAQGLFLLDTRDYFVSVRATNGIGLVTSGTSNGVRIDVSGPSAVFVYDGLAADETYTSSTSTLSANWSFLDPESGIDLYEWAIGTSAGLGDVVAFTPVGTDTFVTATGLALADGWYFVTVRATNGAGQTVLASSNGISVETTAPVSVYVRDGLGADIAYQGSQTSLAAAWHFVDAESGIVGYEWAIGTAPGAVDVRGFTSTGMVESATASSLSLADGLTYFVTVRATNGVGVAATASSDGVTIDVTPPSVSFVYDGLGADVSMQTSNTSLSANWSFADAESGIALYEWAIGTIAGGTTIQPFTGVGTATSATATTLSLIDTQTYYITVRATNGAGLTTTSSSDGVTLDASPPSVVFIYDGSSADQSYIGSTSAVSGNWSFTDSGSGIADYALAIGSSAGGSDVRGFVSLGTSTSGSATGLSLNSGSTYYLTVRATNGMGASTTASSNGFIADGSAPLGGYVRDGVGGDIAYQVSKTTISADWSFSDAESGVTLYEWAIGTTSGATNVRAFTAVGTSQSDAAAGLSLVDGTTYYMTVRATNGAGLQATTSSDGVLVDSTPPSASFVRDGSGADIAVQSSAAAISANWSFIDAQSGIALYEWAIGVTAGGTTIQPFTGVNTATSATASSLSLVDGQTYYITVRATNGAGLAATSTSNGVKVDASPPSLVFIYDGSGADQAYVGSTSTVPGNWSFTDTHSGITGYELGIGSSANATDVRGFVSLGTSTSGSAAGLSLSSGSTYYLTVRATNGAGLSTVASSNGFVADGSAPANQFVYDGIGGDIAFQTAKTSLSAEWSFSDAESGIAQYDWAIGTTAGGTNVRAYTSAGTATNATASSLTLTDGVTYYVTVRATNGAGLQTSTSSNGVRVDSTPPTSSFVRDGVGTDIAYQSSTTVLSSNWSFADPHSGVAQYEWAIGTTSGGTQVQAFTAVGTSTSATANSLALSHGATYYVTVRATNSAGLSATATSDGVRVDTTDPVFGFVNDGSGADLSFQTSVTSISANWSFTDPEGGVANYAWSIGTTIGGAEVRALTSVGTATTGTAVVGLTSGTTYYITVRATNGAGLYAQASSNGVIVDGTPPSVTFVNDGLGADLRYQTGTTALSGNWLFIDPETGVTKYEWALGTTVGGTDVQAFTDVGLLTSGTLGSLALSTHAAYFVTVRATNATGATTTASSNGLWIEATAPALGYVYDGLGADVAYQASATALSANWRFIDRESGISVYEWAIGTTRGGTNVRAFSAVGTAESAIAAVSLSHGTTYYVTVRATNDIALFTTGSSNGVKVDTTPPTVGSVNDGPGADIDTSPLVTLSANWSFADPESGIAAYEWAIGTSAGATNVMPFTYVAVDSSAVATGLNLATGVTYYVTVRATNGAGTSTTASSDGVVLTGTCMVSSVSYPSGQVNPLNSCEACAPDTSTTAFSPRLGGTSSCQVQSRDCGIASDGCGGALLCGVCAAPETCGGGGTSGVCGCTPKTCLQLGKNCGAAPDGCGGFTADCGPCTPPLFCGVGNTCSRVDNLALYTNRYGGTYTIDVNSNIPNLGIGIVSYEAATVAITGTYKDNVVAVLTAGTNLARTVTGVPAAIVTHEDYPSATYPDPQGSSQITAGTSGGADYADGYATKRQIQEYFFTKLGGSVVAHSCQYSAYSGTLLLSAGDTCTCTPFAACDTGGLAGVQCGTVDDGCGGVLSCAGCTPPQVCGGVGLPNRCDGCAAGDTLAAARYPATVVNDPSFGTTDWAMVSNAGISDDSTAWILLTVGQATHYAKATSFGFNLPANATVRGLRVVLEKEAVNGAVDPGLHDAAVRLVKGGVIGATNRSTGAAWAPLRTDWRVSYGGPTDLWGDTWSAADINAANFGVAAAAEYVVSGIGSPGLDSIAVYVCYH